MTILLADPRVAAVPVHESYEPLVTLGASFGPARARVRAGLAARLRQAQVALPVGVSLRVIEGHRPAAVQTAIIAQYAARVSSAFPDAEPEQQRRLTSRFVAPLAVAPHVAGAAVDLTLVDGRGVDIAEARRGLLTDALTGVGLVNHPAQWWHWSYGDRYWALLTGAPAARYGPVTDLDRLVGDEPDGESGGVRRVRRRRPLRQRRAAGDPVDLWCVA